MDVKIGSRWKDFIAAAVESGRYASEADVVSAGLELLAARERGHSELKALIDQAYEDDTVYTDEEVAARVEETILTWENRKAAE